MKLRVSNLFIILFVFSMSHIYGQDIHFRYDELGNRRYRGTSVNVSNLRKGDLEFKISDTVKVDQYVIKVYPNPVNTLLYLEIEGLEPQSTFNYSLYNLSGNLLITSKATNLNSIDLSQFPNGTYILRMHLSQKRIEKWKVIKQ